MSESWPEAVERVADFLRKAGAEARLEEFETDAPTAEAAAVAAGCTLEQIVKSLVLICDDRPLVVLVPGDRRADLEKVARAAACISARVASSAEVERATGFAPGSVAPFPLPRVERVLIDQTLLTPDVVWVGGGSENHLVALRPVELVRLARAQPMDVLQEPAYHGAAKGDA